MSRVSRISLVGRNTCVPAESVTRKPTRYRRRYSFTLPAEVNVRMTFSRVSWVKARTAWAFLGLSARRVLLAAATLRLSSTASGFAPGM